MIEDVRLSFDSDGWRQLLESGGVKDLITDKTNEIAARANSNAGVDGFTANVELGDYGGGRWVGFVHSTTSEAYKAEAENKALTGAIQ